MTPLPHDDTARSARIAGNLFRRESARLVAMLAGQFGVHRLQLAEDVVQEALVRALQTWPYRGVPDNPPAWLTQTAKHLALDHLRREQRWHEKEDGIAMAHERWLAAPAPTEDSETFADNTLRMMFVCFHPQLSSEAQTALALRTLCGLSPAEIAAAFLTSEPPSASGLCAPGSASANSRCLLPCPALTNCPRGSMACRAPSICSSTKATKPPAPRASCARNCATKPSASRCCSQRIPPPASTSAKPRHSPHCLPSASSSPGASMNAQSRRSRGFRIRVRQVASCRLRNAGVSE